MTRSKQQWRQLMRQRIQSLSRSDRQKASARIHKVLSQDSVYCQARTIFFYASKCDEVDTWPMIRKALQKGKRVFLPRANKKNSQMSWGEVKDLKKDLAKGAFDIFEPHAKNKTLRTDQYDLVICPMLGFDQRGTRLGHGGGYYDRFLKTLDNRVQVIGLAFSCQEAERLPRHRYDVPVIKVITD